MAGIRSLVGNLKASYALYNLLHWKKLAPNRRAYKKYGLKRPSWMPLTHRTLEHLPGERPWLDQSSLREIAPDNEEFQKLPKTHQESIKNWSEDGYAIIKGLFSDEDVETINSEVDKLVESGVIKWRYGNKKLMFAIRYSEKIRKIVDASRIDDTLSFLLGKEVRLFQSINFHYGSGQKAHSDSVHMTTHPEGNLIAIWIALEDISPGSGELWYYPGSHKLPYIYNEDFDHGGNYFMLGPRPYDGYEAKIEEVIRQNELKGESFLPKKGDALIWHANLLHGGLPVENEEITRKSMVLHYYGKDAICYHEISQRPTLWL